MFTPCMCESCQGQEELNQQEERRRVNWTRSRTSLVLAVAKDTVMWLSVMLGHSVESISSQQNFWRFVILDLHVYHFLCILHMIPLIIIICTFTQSDRTTQFTGILMIHVFIMFIATYIFFYRFGSKNTILMNQIIFPCICYVTTIHKIDLHVQNVIKTVHKFT